MVSCCTRTASTAGNQIGMAICVDTKRTDFACGGCGRSCQETESCVDGLCTCGAGKVRCGKECIDITGDDGTNCGACGKVCPQICKAGKCTTCAKEGLGTYCGTKQEGHCADLSQADDDCGKCGRACNSGKSCYGGKCL